MHGWDFCLIHSLMQVWPCVGESFISGSPSNLYSARPYSTFVLASASYVLFYPSRFSRLIAWKRPSFRNHLPPPTNFSLLSIVLFTMLKLIPGSRLLTDTSLQASPHLFKVSLISFLRLVRLWSSRFCSSFKFFSDSLTFWSSRCTVSVTAGNRENDSVGISQSALSISWWVISNARALTLNHRCCG